MLPAATAPAWGVFSPFSLTALPAVLVLAVGTTASTRPLVVAAGAVGAPLLAVVVVAAWSPLLLWVTPAPSTALPAVVATSILAALPIVASVVAPSLIARLASRSTGLP